MKKVYQLLSLLILLAIVACKDQSGYQKIEKTDKNGYHYEEVTNDPYKARVYTLENGLKVYLSKNTDAPRIQTMIAVRAGAKDDPRDNTGLAHYLEHMMFKGSSNFGTSDWESEKPLLDSIADLFERHKQTQDLAERKNLYKQIDQVSQEAATYAIQNEYDKIISSLGASGTNAFTSYDVTAYVNEIPANELERFMKLEYDRFENLQLRLFHTELETVYEEFNMYQDMGSMVVMNKAFEVLFPNHPYRVSVIGLPEHLKSPSMYSVMDFKNNYYVPNNMAVCLSGDLDFEESVQVVDKYFGQMIPNENLTHVAPTQDPELTSPQTVEVFTPDAERIMVAYRTNNAKSKDVLYLFMIGEILNNGKAGLIDLNLIKKQKVLQMNAGIASLKDYGAFMFSGTPREGQTLEEVNALIQEEIQKLKNGEFDDDLLEAIINNQKLSVIQNSDSRLGAVYQFMDAFIKEIDWKDHLSTLDEMAKFSKDEIVAFANDFFKENYVTVYKRTGENKDKVAVEKPQITAIKINRDAESAFFKELKEMTVTPIEPVFLDFDELINEKDLSNGAGFYYTKNQNNHIYGLTRFVDISNKTDKKLALAFSYLRYLGTSKYTPEELSMEMYKLAMNFSASSGATRSSVNISGLNETMDRSFELITEVLNDAVPNEEAYANLVDDILKQRANQKLNKSSILRGGMVNYLKYGAHSEFTDILSEEELKAINPQELIDLLKDFLSYQHFYYYYGPDAESGVMAMLNKKNSGEDDLRSVPARVEYPELPLEKPVVYFVNYDMVQVELMLVAKDQVFNVNEYPEIQLFNSYYGGGMNSIIFQEIREARALAYSSYAYVGTPRYAGQSNYINAYIGTQTDKMITAMEAFKELLTNMPLSENAFDITKESMLNSMRSERITKSSIFYTYLASKDLGIDYDIRKPVFEKIQTMQLEDVKTYFDNHVKPAEYSVLVVGDRKKVDFKYLNKIATVKELTLEEIFGY